MQHLRRDPPSRPVTARAAALSDIVQTCLTHGIDADTVERIGRMMIQTAEQMRAIGVQAVGHA